MLGSVINIKDWKRIFEFKSKKFHFCFMNYSQWSEPVFIDVFSTHSLERNNRLPVYKIMKQQKKCLICNKIKNRQEKC